MQFGNVIVYMFLIPPSDWPDFTLSNIWLTNSEVFPAILTSVRTNQNKINIIKTLQCKAE